MGFTPGLKLENGPSNAPSDPAEYSGFEQVRFEPGEGGFVHLYLARSGESVAHYDDGAGHWVVTNGDAIGDEGLDGTWGIILGQAK